MLSRRRYWVDPDTAELYVFHNDTSGTPPPADGPSLVAPVLQELVRVEGEYDGRGAAASPPVRPVVNITFRGIGFRDAARTCVCELQSFYF